MERISLDNPTNRDSVIKRITQVIQKGGIVAIPTDTVYGLVCRVDDNSAIQRIYQIKGREEYSEDNCGMDWKVGAYEPTDQLHGDVEYVYVIDLDKGVLKCRKTTSKFWDKPKISNTKPCAEFPPHKFQIGRES